MPVTILRPTPATSFDGVDGMALVDTGSTTSGVREDIASALALPQRGKRPMSGIGGELQMQRCLFRIALAASNADEAPSFPFVIDDINGIELLRSFAFDMLLGMDVLSQCDLTVRRDRSATLSFG